MKSEGQASLLDAEKTLDYIIENNMSVSRFGDGELINFIYTNLGINNPLFSEEFNPDLRDDLIKILSGNKNKNLLVAIYPCLTKDDYNLSQKYDRHPETILRMNHYFLDFFNKAGAPSIIGDAFCFRRMRCEEETKHAHKRKVFDFFKNKKVLAVSSMSRDTLDMIGVYEDFDIVKINPSNSYKDIDDIESRTLEKYNSGKYDIITCSAGPTASVLANRFAEKGIMFWDIGQVNRI